MKLTVRHLFRGEGQHRRVPLPHGAIVATRFVHCPECGVESAATVHGELVFCAEGHLVSGGVS